MDASALFDRQLNANTEAFAWAVGQVPAEFARVREGQLAVMRGADVAAWREERDTPWGRRSLYWVASKTLQHALEHTNAVLKTALLWEHYERRLQDPRYSAPAME